MSVVPPPPVRDDDPGRLRVTSVEVAAALASGVYGACCVCQGGGVRWLDLSALGMAPVVDQGGTLTDQVALHDVCVTGLVGHWSMILAGPGDDEPPDGIGRDDASRAGEAGTVTWARSTAAAERVSRMGGVYAR